jgi:CDP-paratose 2-epimerase
VHLLVTGSSGLVGSEAAAYFDDLGLRTTGIDNNARADFFGPEGDTRDNQARLERRCKRFTHREMDVRDRAGIDALFAADPPDLVIHAAAQPSHDLAARRPFDDFDVNAGGTLNLLEATRRHAPSAVFILLSTNKVYGDAPNQLPLVELPTRWDFAHPRDRHGIAEDLSIDRSLHSLFGVSKLAADVMTQEYGRAFGLKTCVLRCGCVTGPQHAGVELHGFLSYLLRAAIDERPYTVFGHKGKQVRDQIHARDVVELIWAFAQAPRAGEVYNLGGGRENAASLVECVAKIEQRTGKRPKLSYRAESRAGDHICYYTDLRKLEAHYPAWRPRRGIDEIIDEMVAAHLPARRP